MALSSSGSYLSSQKSGPTFISGAPYNDGSFRPNNLQAAQMAMKGLIGSRPKKLSSVPCPEGCVPVSNLDKARQAFTTRAVREKKKEDRMKPADCLYPPKKFLRRA